MLFPPPPPSELAVTPTAEEVAFFEENGYLVVERITTDEELEWLAQVFEACFDERQALAARTRWDTEAVDGDQVRTRAQAFFPELSVPGLLDTTFRRNGLRYAAALMGVDERELTTWSHMLDKPAGLGRPTYWHQDESYWEPALEHRAVGAWLPLTDCTVDMGCMQFIPGSHERGLLPHRSRRPDIRPDLYEVVEPVDDRGAVACPLPAGGCTFHHSATLHYTAPNSTDRGRPAYAIELETRPVLRPEPLDKPWVQATRDILGHPDGIRWIGNGEWREVTT